MIELVRKYDILMDVLGERETLSSAEFCNILGKDINLELGIELAKAFGIPIEVGNNLVYLKTMESIINNTFCVVDIETTGFSPTNNNIIEIASIKYSNGMIIDVFESYISTDFIPAKITEITGITSDMIVNAPSAKEVLTKFKIFIEDSVFIAHNASFDFNFINGQLGIYNIPVMKNQIICTLALAQKTIKAQKYGLEFLNQFLEINHPIRHRAYADCVITLKVFQESLLHIPPHIKNTNELIKFSKG